MLSMNAFHPAKCPGDAAREIAMPIGPHPTTSASSPSALNAWPTKDRGTQLGVLHLAEERQQDSIHFVGPLLL